MNMAIRRVEAFLHLRHRTFDLRVGEAERTGRTTRSGFFGSLAVAFRIISLACLRFAALSAPIFPNCIKASVKGLKTGARDKGDMVVAVQPTALIEPEV
jgi:hypothetical protein